MPLSPQLIQDISRLQRRSLRHSRQLEVPRPYIAARFSILPAVFHPGNQKQYGGFDNRGLEPGHRYVLFVLAVLQKNEPVSPPWCLPTFQLGFPTNLEIGVGMGAQRTLACAHHSTKLMDKGTSQ